MPVPLKRSHRHILPLRNGDYEQDDRSFPSLSPHACMLSHFNHVWLFAALWTIACQAPLSMGFSRQKYCSGLLCPPPGIFPTQGSNPHLLCILYWQVGSLPLVPPGKTQKKEKICIYPEKNVHPKGCTQCSLQHCLQQPRHGNHLNTHRGRNGQRRRGAFLYNGTLLSH